NQQKPRETSAAKRRHEEGEDEQEKAKSLESGIKGLKVEEAKRQKIGKADGSQAALFNYASDSDSEEGEKADTKDIDHEGDETQDGDGQLPAGFFDEGFEPEIDDQNTSTEIEEQAADAHEQPRGIEEPQINLPQGFFDNAVEQEAVKTGQTIDKVEAGKEKKLKKDLADFESEIAGLVEEGHAIRTEDEVRLHKSFEDDLEQQDELWKARTSRLAKMRSVIEDGIKQMDPAEATEPAQTDDVDTSDESDGESSDDAEYEEFLDWRSSKV
ncbi:hypothetical protein GGI12_005569, partial [Dipsacomyces acuminosporus]